jgi:mono/diheme cytochrome c family protein
LTQVKARDGPLSIVSAWDRHIDLSPVSKETTMTSGRGWAARFWCAMGALIAGTVLAQPARIDLGKREFETKCAVCHGRDGKGAGPYAEQLKRTLPDLTTLAKRNGGVFPVTRTYETIEGAGKGHGTRDMPVWGLDYTIQATEALPELPYNQAIYVRTRIMSLLEYLTQLQVK